MSTSILQKISDSLAIRPASLLPVQVDGVEVLQAQSARGTPYLAIAIEAAPSGTIAESALKKVLLQLPTVTTGLIVTAEAGFLRALRKSPRTGDFDRIGFQPQTGAPFDEGLFPLTWKQLRPLQGNVEYVLFEVHSALRDIDGLHAPEALDEICKLLYAKLYDEECIGLATAPAFQRDRYGSADECAAEIRSLYLAAIASDEAAPRLAAAVERARGVFSEGLLLSSAAISRAAELLQHFNLSASAIDIKGRAFQNVLLPAMRAGMGQYFTPKEVIDFIVDVISPKSSEKILDPFCGSGHFLTASLDHVRNRRLTSKLARFAADKLHGIEKSDRMVRIALTDMRLHGDGHTHIRCADALLPFQSYADIEPNSFDVILTNPPFGVDLTEEALRSLGPFELARGGSVSMEIVALERCVQLLRPGGRLAIVLPDGILSNKNTLYVRDWMKDKLEIRAIASLPPHAFSPFGANIKTSVIFASRRGGTPSEWAGQVTLCELDAIGYDGAGRHIEKNELQAAAQQIKLALREGGW